MSRAFDRLYRLPRPQWCGVNLGGWLVLERGPSAPFFEANGLAGDSGEWDATLALREAGRDSSLDSPLSGRDGPKARDVAAEAIGYHRSRHTCEADFAEIARRGFNAVRLPSGYY